MQTYGGYVMDQSGSFNWYAEASLAGSAWDLDARGPN